MADSVALDLSVNIAATVICAVSSVVGTLAAQAILSRFRPLARATGFRARDRAAVSYGLVPPAAGGYYSVEEGDLSAISRVYAATTQIIRKDRVSLINHIDMEGHLATCDHIVSVSGPYFNKLTEFLVGSIGLPAKFVRSDGTIRTLADPDERFGTTYASPGRPSECHAILARGIRIRPDGEEQNCIIVAGLSNLSTLAAAIVLQRIDRYIRRFAEAQSNALKPWPGSWCWIIKVVSWRSDDEAIAKLPAREDQLSISVVRSFTASQFASPYDYHF